MSTATTVLDHMTGINKAIKISWDFVEDSGVECENIKDADGVEKMMAAGRKLVELNATLQASKKAVEAITAGEGWVEPQGDDPEATDFLGLITAKRDAVMAGMNVDPDSAAPYNKLKKRVWDVYHKGQPMPGDDDDIVEEGGDDGVKNMRCPISGKEVDLLEEPVADQQGIIYEKKMIVGTIRRGTGNPKRIKCPQFGTSHYVTLADLEDAEHLMRARRRRQAREANAHEADIEVEDDD